MIDQNKRDLRSGAFEWKDPADPTNTVLIQPGMYIRHDKFGMGLVISIEDHVLKAQFGQGVKKFILPQAFDLKIVTIAGR